MSPEADGPSEHRRRRRAAHERAAVAHQRAAEVEDLAAAFFEAQGLPDDAERHRARAKVDRAEALREHKTAEQQ